MMNFATRISSSSQSRSVARVRAACRLGALALATITAPAITRAQDAIHYVGRLGDQLTDFVPEGYTTGTALRGAGREVAWVGHPTGGMRRVGFYDSVHTGPDGQWLSSPQQVNRNGVTIGTSLAYQDAGLTAWVANRDGDTLRLGLYDPSHIRPDGSYLSMPVDVNGRNQVVGYSEGASDDARSCWIVRPYVGTRTLGLNKAGRIPPNGNTWSTPVAINDAGHVIGMSRYYADPSSSEFGYTTWLWLAWDQMREIGFQSGAHRSATGRYDGAVQFLTDSGYIGGSSRRYRRGTDDAVGYTAWVTAVDGPNRPVGFYDGIHTAWTEVATSKLVDLNEAGTSAGYSNQYGNVGTPIEENFGGRTAWLATPAGRTIRVGLYDDEHSRMLESHRYQHNEPIGLNATDSAIGFAVRFPVGVGGDLGRDGWVANLAGYTTRIGLTDASHTGSDGARYTMPTGLSGSAYVWGYSRRYTGSRTSGTSAWIYNRKQRTYVVLQSVSPAPAGFASASVRINDVDASGRAFGTYGSRAFVYTPGQGVQNLDAALDVDPAADGWREFGDPTFVSDGYIAGIGQVGDNPWDLGVYLLHR